MEAYSFYTCLEGKSFQQSSLPQAKLNNVIEFSFIEQGSKLALLKLLYIIQKGKQRLNRKKRELAEGKEKIEVAMLTFNQIFVFLIHIALKSLSPLKF